MNDGTKRVSYWMEERTVTLFGLFFLTVLSFIWAVKLGHCQEEKPDEKQFAQVSVGTRSGMASGTVIHRSGQTYWIITNQHVIEPHRSQNRKLWVITQQKRFAGTLLYASIDRKEPDLALVRVEMAGIDIKPAVLATDLVKVGDTVYRNGRGTGFWKGEVWKFSEFRTSYGTTIRTNIPFSANGDSGAGLFNRKGELVGVHFGMVAETNNPDDLDEEFPKNASGEATLEQVRKVLDKYLPKS